MVRKIFTGSLLALSSILLAFSVIGVAAIWIYNEQLKRESADILVELDLELSQAQATLQSSQKELERALGIVDSTEKALEKLTEQSGDAENIFDSIQGTLDNDLIPDLKSTRERIDAARSTLEDLQSVLGGISSLVPFVDLKAPDKILADLVVSATSLDSDIAEIEVIAQQASTFVSDTSYLLGGDLTETKDSLPNFLTSIKDYEKKVTRWREQVTSLTDRAPGWIDRASIALTIFLLWFALSQFGLILHGLSLQYGDNPLWLLRGK
jgi:DNA repair exonuclease SbcCD ATPase subunit